MTMTVDLAGEVARRQQVRLNRRAVRCGTARPAAKVSRWVHVPLGELFAERGNRLHDRSRDYLETGHEPFHTSKSGRCVFINPKLGSWTCRSCREHGDASALVMRLLGCSYRQAAAWLTERYGPPTGHRQRRERQILEAVIA